MIRKERTEIDSPTLDKPHSEIVIHRNAPSDAPSTIIPDRQHLYQIISLSLSLVFAIVGLVFLLFPGDVIVLFNGLSRVVGMVEAPVEGSGFYLILAVGYMYVVSLLSFLMYRNPVNTQLLLVLINAKSSSSVLSLFFFVLVHPYLIFLVNGIVDGSIALGLLVLCIKMKGTQR